MATKKGSRKPFSERDVACITKLAKRLRSICKMEKVPVGALEAMANVSPATVRGIQTGKRNFNIINLMRVAEVLGYELILAKRTDARRISEDPDAMIKISQFKERQKDAQRRHRGQPEGQLPTKVRVRKEKRGEDTLMIHSRRDQVASMKRNDDFLNPE